MQSAPVAPTMVANPGPTTNPAAGEKHDFFKIYMNETALCQRFSLLNNSNFK